MKRIIRFAKSILVLIAIMTQYSYGQLVEEGLKTINERSLKGQLSFLASDWMEGRESETKGAFMAGDYIASMFQVYGIEPFGDLEFVFPFDGQRGSMPESKPSYFQKLNIIKYKLSDDQSFSLSNERSGSRFTKKFDYGVDYLISGIETNTELDASVVFVGYGIKNDSLKYNDFAKLDVKGKIILRLDGYPGYRDTTSSSYKKLKFSNLWKDKENWAIEAGAIGVINLTSNPIHDFGKAKNLPFRYERGEIESDKIPEEFYDKRAILANDFLHKSLPLIRVSGRLQNELLESSNINLYSFEQDAKGILKSSSKEIGNMRIGIKSAIVSELLTVRNVVGKIEGVNKNEFIVVGAHYDHLGKYNEYIFNGADDNGSGTVGVMSIARALTALGRKPEKTIIFAAWTGEEKGLLGSEYFVKNFPELTKLAANFNFDMIGRNSLKDSLKNKCGITYTSFYPGFKDICERNVRDFKLNLDITYTGSEKPTGGSDYAPFAEKNIPVMSFMSAMHPDYHKPSDEVAKIDWKKMERIVKLGFLNIYELANSDIKKFKTGNK